MSCQKNNHLHMLHIRFCTRVLLLFAFRKTTEAGSIFHVCLTLCLKLVVLRTSTSTWKARISAKHFNIFNNRNVTGNTKSHPVPHSDRNGSQPHSILRQNTKTKSDIPRPSKTMQDASQRHIWLAISVESMLQRSNELVLRLKGLQES